MQGNIFTTLDDLAQSIENLRNQLEPLRRLAPESGSAGRPKARRRRRRKAQAPARQALPRKVRKARKTVRPLSPKVRALRKLQGRYMGLVRGLTAAQKVEVKKVKQEKGYAPALKLAASLGK